MDKIKRFGDIYIPVTTCTLRCDYCYITQNRLFEGPLPKTNYTPEFVRKALSKERLGGTCLLNMCGGGETLLAPHITEYIRELLEEGHYVGIVTNATTTQEFEKMAQFPRELTKRLFFKFSYHYTQLKERKLLDRFFKNIKTMREAGASFTLEATPSDEWISYIDEMKQAAIENVGALCHVTVARDQHAPKRLPILTSLTREEYERTWGQFDSELFRYKLSIFEKPRREFCYAGAWSFLLNLFTGEMKQCYKTNISQNIYEDVTQSIRWIPIGNNCREHHCYNGHSFLAFGCIPQLAKDAPTYAEERNRRCIDGTEWLQPEMKAFMSSRLYESNKQLNFFERWLANQKVRHIGLRSKLLSKLRLK